MEVDVFVVVVELVVPVMKGDTKAILERSGCRLLSGKKTMWMSELIQTASFIRCGGKFATVDQAKSAAFVQVTWNK